MKERFFLRGGALAMGILVASVPAFTEPATFPPASDRQDRVFPLEAGSVLGIGGPYACGWEGAFYPRPWFNVNAGLGIQLAGIKYGAGAKVFLFPLRRVSPFLGANYFFSTGTPTITIIWETDPDGTVVEETKFRALPGQTLALRAGLRYALPASFKLYGTAGYGIAVRGGQIRYRGESVRGDLDFLFKAAGPELSFGVSWMFPTR